MAYYATYMPNETGELQKVVINAGVGFVLPYYGETAPPGTLACDGSEISRTVYDELFQVLGTKAGAGDGSTTFNLPDLRGQFVRGTGGNAAALGERQGDAIRNITGEFFNAGYGTAVVSLATHIFSGAFSAGNRTPAYAGAIAGDVAILNTCGARLDVSTVVPTAAENRPVNVALLWCIIYE